MQRSVDELERTIRLHRLARVGAVLLLILGGCSSEEPAPTATATAALVADEGCPMTVPPAEPFVPPDPWPAVPSSSEFVWYGSDDLWTVLEVGRSMENKSVWWSVNFTSAAFESQPEIAVVFERLDVEADAVVFASPGTNAYTPEDELFMINGIEPRDPGCWQATATYKGATLQYVYSVPGGSS